MTVSPRIRVGIIEDHAIFRAGTRLILSSQPGFEVVGDAANRKEAFELAQRERPDIFLVDIQLATESAIDFLEELLKVSGAKAILLTSSDSKEVIERAIEAGASGLVYKGEAPQTLFRAIERVHAGEAWFSRSLLSSALVRLRTQRSDKTKSDPDTKVAQLTARELEIAVLV